MPSIRRRSPGTRSRPFCDAALMPTHAGMGGLGKRVCAALVLAFAVACPLWVTSATGHSSAPGSQPSAGRASSAVEAGIRACANRNREARGMPALEHDTALDRAARFHARRMLAKGFFDHTDPAGKGPDDRVRRYARRRYVIVGENIAAGFESVAGACR